MHLNRQLNYATEVTALDSNSHKPLIAWGSLMYTDLVITMVLKQRLIPDGFLLCVAVPLQILIQQLVDNKDI